MVGFTPLSTHMASIVNFTPPGGCAYFEASERSESFRFLRTATAASRAGNASARSRSAEDLISAHSAALTSAMLVSLATTSCVLPASALSMAICSIITSTSLDVWMSTGCISSICLRSTATSSSVEASLSRPMTSRFLAVPTCSRFCARSVLNVESTSRYDVGVT